MARKSSLPQRTFLFVLSVLLFIVVASLLYKTGMRFLEGEERGFWQSVETVVESMTTTGYGNDSPWTHPLMNVYVILIQFSGLFFFVLLFPIYFIPLLEKRFEQRLPTEAPDMNGHVLIFHSDIAISSVLRELERAQRPVLVLEEDEVEARRLQEQEHRVVHRSLDDEALEAAGLLRAKTVIANGSDGQNASLILAARKLGFEGEIITLVENPTHMEALMMAGSSTVLTPRQLLAVALAARASERVSPTIAGAHQLGHKLEVFQIRVQPDSKIAGRKLGEAALGARTGAFIIGQWVDGKLETTAGADMVIRPRGILVVAGSRESIEKLISLAEGARPILPQGPFIVVGSGDVGGEVIELLRQAGERVMVIDKEPGEGVDLAGDILDTSTIEQATMELAQAVILAIDSDNSTLFATVIIRDYCFGVPILARVNEAENLEKIYRAGADFALSFSQVAGSLLTNRLLGQHAFELDPQLKLLKVKAGVLSGRHPTELEIRSRTGCSVIAVERGESLFTEFDNDFCFQNEDEVYVCGDQQAVERFQSVFST